MLVKPDSINAYVRYKGVRDADGGVSTEVLRGFYVPPHYGTMRQFVFPAQAGIQ